MNTEVLFL